MRISETDRHAAPSEPSAAIDAEAIQVARDAADTSDEPTGPKKIAVVMAHPDDAEFICAGTIARWADEGHEVVYVLLTSGDKGSDDPEMTPETARRPPARPSSGKRPASWASRTSSSCDVADAELEPNLELRTEMMRVIRRLKPDVVVCQDPTVRWVDTQYINHPDHRAAGEATLAAVFPAARDRMTFPELLAEGLEPHKVREIYLAGAQTPDVAIDITAQMERKLDSLRAHVSQIGDWDFEPMVRRVGQGDRRAAPRATGSTSRASSTSSSTESGRHESALVESEATAGYGGVRRLLADGPQDDRASLRGKLIWP